MYPTINRSGLDELLHGFDATFAGDWTTTITQLLDAPGDGAGVCGRLDGHDLDKLVRDAIHTATIDLGGLNNIYVHCLAADPDGDPSPLILLQVRLGSLRLLSGEPFEMAELLPHWDNNAPVYITQLLHAVLSAARDIMDSDVRMRAVALPAEDWHDVLTAIEVASNVAGPCPRPPDASRMREIAGRLRAQVG